MGRYTPGPAGPPHLKIHILTPQKETCHFCQNWNNEKAKVMLLTRKVYANSAEVAATFPQTQLAAESHRGRGAIATAKEEAEFHSNAPAISTAKEEAKLHSNAPVVSTGKVEVKTPQQRSRGFYRKSRGQNSTATLQQFPQQKTGAEFHSNAPAISTDTTCRNLHERLQQCPRDFHSRRRGKNSTAMPPQFPQQKTSQKLHSNAPAISTAEDEPKTPQQRSRNFHSKSRAKNSTATLPRFPQQKEDTKLHSNATAVSTGKVEVKTSHESSRYFYRKSRGQNSTATLPRFKGIGFKNSHWHSVTIVTLCDHCHCHRLKVSMNDF